MVSCADTPQKESSVQEIETALQRSDRQFEESMPDITSKLKLQDLRKGVDSFEVRIWCPIAGYNEQLIIVIKYLDSAWLITENHVWESYPDYEFKRNDTVNHLLDVKIDSVKSKAISPNINKKLFADSLQNFYLANFPTTKELVNSTSLPTDAFRYIFEIAQKKEYKLLDYGWGDATSKYELHDRVHRLLRFLQRHLDSKIYYWK